MNRRPIIVCACYGLSEGGAERLCVNKAYADAIRETGGTLVMLTGALDAGALAGIIGMADGLLLPGGDDFNPRWYGQEVRGSRGTFDNQRDETEFSLLKEAMRRGMPILAICRGMQIVNVSQGGTLYQDLESEMKGAARHDFHAANEPRSTIDHEVIIRGGTRLQKILGVSKIGVNSLHHQGVAEIGKGLTVVATALDGLVEAIELEGYPYLVGVQWHPEELIADPTWKLFFSDFISEAVKAKGERLR